MRVFFVPLKEGWIWSSRIVLEFEKYGDKIQVFEPKNGLIGHVLNMLHMYFKYLFLASFNKDVKVVISFASTNGYIASYLPYLTYTLLIQGSDILLEKNDVRKRTLRALRFAKKVYASSAVEYLNEYSKLNKIPLYLCQKKQWGLNFKDFELIDNMLYKHKSVINIAGIRHAREHYCIEESISLFHLFNQYIKNSKFLYFIGDASDLDIEILNTLTKGLVIDIYKSMDRCEFLLTMSQIDIGISLAKSDLFGGPVLELIAMGGYVVLFENHPLAKLKDKHDLSGILIYEELEGKNPVLDFSQEGRKGRSKLAMPFLKGMIFEQSIKELRDEYI
jgi:hypothetical protein